MSTPKKVLFSFKKSLEGGPDLPSHLPNRMEAAPSPSPFPSRGDDMSRRSRARHRKRKARRQAIREGRLPARRPYLPLLPEENDDVHGPIRWRDPRTRWLGLCSRGGHTLSFRPTGLRMDVDLTRPDAAEVFSETVLRVLESAPTVD